MFTSLSPVLLGYTTYLAYHALVVAQHDPLGMGMCIAPLCALDAHADVDEDHR